MEQTYRIVFDVTQVGFQWWIPFLICIFAGLFVVICWGLRTSGEQALTIKGVLFQLGGIVGIIAALAFAGAMYIEYRNAEKALTTNQYSIVEGVVTNFIPMPPGGHSIESFTVNGIHFEYGSGWGSTVFNSDRNNGFIHNGVQVRIAYHNQDILRVEVK